MKFLLLTSLFSVAFSIAVSAQPASVCSNETVAGISSRGIKIGVVKEDLKTILADDYSEKEAAQQNQKWHWGRSVGFESISVGLGQKSTSTGNRFEGISRYSLTLLDEMLTAFSVQYPWVKWDDSNQFADAIAKEFRLPSADKWSGDRSRLELSCGDYKVSVVTPANGNEFSVTDTRTQKIVEQRVRKNDEEQQKIQALKKYG